MEPVPEKAECIKTKKMKTFWEISVIYCAGKQLIIKKTIMIKKSILFGVLGLVAAGTVAYSAQALAYRGNPGETGPNYSPERHEQMEKAFENNDYNAWKSLMNGRGRATDVVNEGNFSRFAEAHRLTEEGKTDEANKIREELGLGQRDGSGSGQRGQNRNGNFVDANGDGVRDRLQ